MKHVESDVSRMSYWSPVKRLAPKLAAFGVVAAAAMLSGACGEDPISVPLRSLERSGDITFLCLGGPSSAPGRPLSACRNADANDPEDFESEESENHLYALLTQATRGEIAVIDLSSDTLPVLDQDPTTPGANFLPVGAQPDAIVSTPGGTATFVGVQQIGREAIYVLPSNRLRPFDQDGVPTLSSWPACTLPGSPGKMVLVADPEVDGQVRSSCDGEYGTPDGGGANGNIDGEGNGRQKLIVTLPDFGGFAVLDAQQLLEMPDGSLSPCEIERWVELEVSLPPGQAVRQPPAGEACVQPVSNTPTAVGPFTSRPAGIDFADGRLYLSDVEAPVIHVVDVASPCEPLEQPPLLPSSVAQPDRVVRTRAVAVMQSPTPEFSRFLYAVDLEEGSAMVFDVGDQSQSRSPLLRDRAELSPNQPADRVLFSAPIQDIAIVARDQPESHPATGVAAEGTRCDPDPGLQACTANATSCDVETLYRTSASYDDGAGPLTLRGTFATLMLTSGQIAVIDIDDYDSACRGPKSNSPLLGCPAANSDEPAEGGNYVSTGERSCRVVQPHTARSGTYFLQNEDVGRNQPGLVSFALLYDRDGTIYELNDPEAPETPQLRATLPSVPTSLALELAVSGTVESIDEAGVIPSDDGIRHTLAMNFEDPRAHVRDQDWSVTFEGALPGFSGRVGDLRLSDERILIDENSGFCSNGVHSEAAVREILAAEGLSASEIDALAPALADRIQITQPLVEQDDYYYSTAACTFQECKTAFGTVDTPTVGRDISILEAFQDRVELSTSSAGDELTECCFPTLASYQVRGGNQWIVNGSSSGFLHRVVADPESGRCRDSCDPNLVRLNARVRGVEGPTVLDGAPGAFLNPMFRFAITGGTPIRGDQFRFTTQGSFRALVVNLAANTIDVQPQTIRFLQVNDQLAVTDGSLEGLLLIGADTLSVERQIF